MFLVPIGAVGCRWVPLGAWTLRSLRHRSAPIGTTGTGGAAPIGTWGLSNPRPKRSSPCTHGGIYPWHRDNSMDIGVFRDLLRDMSRARVVTCWSEKRKFRKSECRIPKSEFDRRDFLSPGHPYIWSIQASKRPLKRPGVRDGKQRTTGPRTTGLRDQETRGQRQRTKLIVDSW